MEAQELPTSNKDQTNIADLHFSNTAGAGTGTAIDADPFSTAWVNPDPV